MTAIPVGRPYSPGAPGGAPAGALAPAAPFDPADYDSALVHIARGEALNFITHASTTAGGHRIAWEACVSLAEALMPLASTDNEATFIKAYQAIVIESARRRSFLSRALWRICSLEMKRQKRLGDSESLPMDKEDFGLQPAPGA